jgi:hypothetical protein
MPRVGRFIASVAAVLALTASFGGWLDVRGGEHLDAALERALVSFALARTLNGVISVLQETQIALQPAGVGVTLAPGEILDPLNDLIERFSYVMLLASAALGVERVLLAMSGWWGVTVVLVTAVVLWLGTAWFGGADERWRRWATRLLLVALFLRFAIPVLLIATHLVSSTFLQAQADTATEALRATSRQADEVNEQVKPENEADDRSLLERFSSAIDRLDFEAKVRQLREDLTHAVEHIIDLIVVFLLETVLVPLALLWLLMRFVGSLLTGGMR